MDYREYFKDNEHVLEKLEKLHQKKYEIKNLLEDNKYNQPYVVEFSGLPRTGKSSSVGKIYDFFRSAGIKIEKTKEPAEIIKESHQNSKTLSNLQFNNLTLEISKKELENKKKTNPNIIIQDRGIVDNYYWYQMMYEKNELDKGNYLKILSGLKNDLNQNDQVYILLADPKEIVYRDYINQIYLEERKKTNIKSISNLQIAFDNLLPIIQENLGNTNLIKLNTTNLSEIDTSIIIADNILDGIKNKILKNKDLYTL